MFIRILSLKIAGTKLVFQPFFNNAKCRYNRYQPFTFSTDGTSRCVYQKSFCNEEGQFVFQNGSFRNDTICGCNSSKGFYFVTKPNNVCYCLPSEEDCSCYKPSCMRRNNSKYNSNLRWIQLLLQKAGHSVSDLISASAATVAASAMKLAKTY